MKSKPVEQLLLELQVTPSHSRPRVSNDNPYSEAGFKTMKYSPHFPERFSSQEEAQTFCWDYFVWYNTRHHTSLELLTPEQVHFGDAPKFLAQRQVTLDAAYAAYPKRFKARPRRDSCPRSSGSIRRPYLSQKLWSRWLLDPCIVAGMTARYIKTLSSFCLQTLTHSGCITKQRSHRKDHNTHD